VREGIAPDLSSGHFSIFLCLEMAYSGVYSYTEFHTYQESDMLCYGAQLYFVWRQRVRLLVRVRAAAVCRRLC